MPNSVYNKKPWEEKKDLKFMLIIWVWWWKTLFYVKKEKRETLRNISISLLLAENNQLLFKLLVWPHVLKVAISADLLMTGLDLPGEGR